MGSMKINYNATAMVSNNSINRNDNALSESTKRLSSGLKINNAKDNPSGLAMAKRMNLQLEGLQVGKDNSNEGISIVRTADGALSEITEMLQRMNELAVKGANGTMSDSDRKTLQDEVTQLKEEIHRISSETQFNGQNILDGTFDLKGYSDNEDVKVLSYSDEMLAGTYSIDALKATFKDGVIEEIKPEDMEVTVKRTLKGGTVQDTLKMKVTSYRNDTITLQGDGGYELQLKLDVAVEISEAVENVKVLKCSGGMPEGTYSIEALKATLKDGVIEEIKPEDKIVTVKCQSEGGTVQGIKMEVNSYQNDTVTLKGVEEHAGYELQLQLDVENLTSKPVDISESMSLELTGIGAMRMQVGANEGQIMELRIPSVSLSNLQIEKLDMTTKDGCLEAIDSVAEAIAYVSSVRSRLGAYENRLEHKINSLDTTHENMTAAYSTIMDVDMAEEMTVYTTKQVLAQSGMAMLAQANERPSQVLQLLQ